MWNLYSAIVCSAVVGVSVLCQLHRVEWWTFSQGVGFCVDGSSSKDSSDVNLNFLIPHKSLSFCSFCSLFSPCCLEQR